MQREEPGDPAVRARSGAPAAHGAARPRPAAVALLAAGALCCFAANSLLARAALRGALVDPASFTALRIVSGAAFLVALAAARGGRRGSGSWASAAILVAYAAPFSFAYVRMPTGAGALLLFAAVQVTMIGVAVAQGARPTPGQWAGVTIALGGLAALTLPGAHGADAGGSALMVLAGAAWGVYTLRGRAAARDPLATTADNFARATALALPLAAAALAASGARLTATGAALAVASGALASGGGYTLWYAVVPALGATRAAALQLAVPVLAAAGGVALLGERVTTRLVVSAGAILCGIALTLSRRRG